MSKYCIYVPLDPYLAQWFVHEHGGETPVRLVRGSVESKLLAICLGKRPRHERPDLGGEGRVPVLLPESRLRPPETYNHLPPHAMRALQKVIRSRFDVQLWSELHCFGKIGRRQDDLIYAWMEKHGIEISDTNWNAIAKRYQRQRNLYRMREASRERYEAKKNH